MKVALFLLGAFIAPTLAKNFGGINVDGVGTVYVVGPDWAGDFVQVTSNELKLNGGGRVYFASSPSDGFSPDIYWKVSFWPAEGRLSIRVRFRKIDFFFSDSP